MEAVAAKASTTPAQLASAVAKLRVRLIPFLFLLYVVAYLDRINVGFAALQMNQALGFSARTYGLGAGIFFVSYVAFEIPSNIILARVGPRRWIARIMVTWGIASCAMMLVRGTAGFLTARFLLGLAEAGFFPGIIFYLTCWFPARERAHAIATFMTAVFIAGVVGGPISGALLALDGMGGLAGWQWLFLLEGLPAIVLGFVVWAVLIERPEEAAFLTGDERHALIACLAEERKAQGSHAHTVRDALSSGRIWLLAVLYFTIPVGLYAVSFWLPQIIKQASNGSDLAIGTLSAIPYLVGAIAMVVVGRHSDRTGERHWHVAIPAWIGAAGFVLSTVVHGLAPSIVALSIATLGFASMYGPFWTLAASEVSGVGAAAAIALINSVGNTAGFVGPYILGYVLETTQSFAAGLISIGAILVFGGALALAIRRSAGDAGGLAHGSRVGRRL